MDLEEFSRWVVAEIGGYRYHYSEGLLGNPLSEERVKAELQELRSALITPRWAEIRRRDTIERMEMADSPLSTCIVVARARDVKGTILSFDPAAGEFLLAHEGRDSSESFDVSGDIVGCFMAR